MARRKARARNEFQRYEIITSLLHKIWDSIYPERSFNLKQIKQLLYAIQHIERYSSTTSKRGRRPKFERDFLIRSSVKIKAILLAQTAGKISILRFISTYLPVTDYPQDILDDLAVFTINLEEARIINRLNKKNLGDLYRRKPYNIRRDVIKQHLARRGTQSDLRRVVAAKIGKTQKAQVSTVSKILGEFRFAGDHLIELDEHDSEHLLFEEIKTLVVLARNVDTEQIAPDALDQIFNDLDSLKLRLMKWQVEN